MSKFARNGIIRTTTFSALAILEARTQKKYFSNILNGKSATKSKNYWQAVVEKYQNKIRNPSEEEHYQFAKQSLSSPREGVMNNFKLKKKRGMTFALSLKQLLLDELKLNAYLPSTKSPQIMVDHGHKISNAERRLRNETSTEFLPIVKLGRDKNRLLGAKNLLLLLEMHALPCVWKKTS